MSTKLQKIVKITIQYNDGTTECLCDNDAKTWFDEINQAIVLLHMNIQNYEFPSFKWIPGKEKKISKKYASKRTSI